MKNIIPIFLCVTLVFGCRSNKILVCNCCENIYYNINDALSCIFENPDTTTPSDDRLLLLAFVNREWKEDSSLGWGIIKDPKIKSQAKRNYLLTFQEQGKFNDSGQNDPELIQLINEHSTDSVFFIIANQAIFPFGSWSLKTPKNSVLDQLQIGNGP